MVITFEDEPLALQTLSGKEVYRAKLEPGDLNLSDREVYAVLNREIAAFIEQHPNLAGLLIDATAIGKLNFPGISAVRETVNDREIGSYIRKITQVVMFGVGEQSVTHTYVNWFFKMTQHFTHASLLFKPTEAEALAQFRKRKGE